MSVPTPGWMVSHPSLEVVRGVRNLLARDWEGLALLGPVSGLPRMAQLHGPKSGTAETGWAAFENVPKSCVLGAV